MKLPPHYQAAHDALKLWGEANRSGNIDRQNVAYDSYMRALRQIDIAEYDAEVVDDFGNVLKPANKSHSIDSHNQAWLHDLPEDGLK